MNINQIAYELYGKYFADLTPAQQDEEPKAGEWCYFWDDIKHPVIRRYNRLNNTIALYKYIDESEGGWAFCRRLSDEAQVILNREIENIKAR